MVLIPEVPSFFKKGSVFGVTLHSANTEHPEEICLIYLDFAPWRIRSNT